MPGNVMILDGEGNAITEANPLPVTPVSSGVDQDVNIVAVAGAAVATGNGTAAGALRVALPTDGTGVVILGAGTASIGKIDGQTAVSSSASGNPVTMGLVARGTTGGSVTAGSVARVAGNSQGVTLMWPFAAQELSWSYAAASGGIANTTTAVTFKAAHASERNYITSIQWMSESLTNATELAVRDGAGGTVLWRTKIPATTVVLGQTITFPVPIRGTAATLLEVLTITASGAGAVYFNAAGFTAP